MHFLPVTWLRREQKFFRKPACGWIRGPAARALCAAPSLALPGANWVKYVHRPDHSPGTTSTTSTVWKWKTTIRTPHLGLLAVMIAAHGPAIPIGRPRGQRWFVPPLHPSLTSGAPGLPECILPIIARCWTWFPGQRSETILPGDRMSG